MSCGASTHVLLTLAHNLSLMLMVFPKEQRVSWDGGGDEVNARPIGVDGGSATSCVARDGGRRDAHEQRLLLHEVGREREEVRVCPEEAPSFVHDLRDIIPHENVVVISVGR